jgi:hypothetical protein
MKRYGVHILSSLVVIAASQLFSVYAADKPTALLHSSGTTMVNGSGTNTTALFDGDEIQTLSGLVTISSPGSTVLVPSNSRVMYKQNVVNLSGGIASINTTNGMGAQAEGFLIAPANGSTAKFDVKRSGTLVQVHSISGTLKVNSLGTTLAIVEGQTATLDPANGPLKSGLVGSGSASFLDGSSSSSLFNLNQTLSNDAGKLPYCSTIVCQSRSHVSKIKACKCFDL